MLKATEKLLWEAEKRYRSRAFIEFDPISIPHMFSQREDIEIAGFLTASLSWGRRTAIIQKTKDWMERMDMHPFDFVMHASSSELKKMNGFVYRTFQLDDVYSFLACLKSVYIKYGSLESCFFQGHAKSETLIESALKEFPTRFFQDELYTPRSTKHVSSPERGSACKRLNMYLRWMVRKDEVDFGLWNQVSPADLKIPLDVHVGNTARNLGLLKRPSTDWKAVLELSEILKTLDPADPVRFDFALFGLSAMSTFE